MFSCFTLTLCYGRSHVTFHFLFAPETFTEHSSALTCVCVCVGGGTM